MVCGLSQQNRHLQEMLDSRYNTHIFLFLLKGIYMCVHICVYVCIYTYPYLDAHVDETFLEVYSKKPTLEMGLGDWQPRKEGVFKIFPFWVLSCFLPHACMPKRCMLEHWHINKTERNIYTYIYTKRKFDQVNIVKG